MTCLNLSFPGSLLSHFRGVQLTVKAQVRCISQGVFRTDSSPRPARSLSSRSVLSVPTLYLQPCSTRRVSQAGSDSGWYASVADSAPVHFTEQLLISSQQMTALPWWAGIICTTVALRTVITLPLAVYQATIIAKVSSHALTSSTFAFLGIKNFFCIYKNSRIQIQEYLSISCRLGRRKVSKQNSHLGITFFSVCVLIKTIHCS